MNKYITYSDEVKNALENNLPIVALESTIISHGMPYPKNLETAKKCEDVIRRNGCVPATIAILDGKLKVGLNEKELEYLAKATGVIKASRRDIPYIVANSLNGATTVLGTMYVADFAVCMKNGENPESKIVQELVEKLQNYITESYYNCTKDILAGLVKCMLLMFVLIIILTSMQAV